MSETDDVAAGAERAVAAELSVRLPDGRRLSYAEFGDASGEPVLVFHGFPNTGAFGAVLHEAASEAGLRLICPTRPGLGDSDPQPDRTLLDWPADVAALTNALNVDEFPVVGVSAGGPYALACAATLDDVTRVALLAGIGPPDAVTSLERKLSFAIPRYVSPVSRLLLWLQNRAVLSDPEARRESLLEDAPPADRPVLESSTYDALAVSSREARKNGAKPLVRELVVTATPWQFDLADVDVPVALYYAGADQLVPASDGEYLAARLPDAELTVDDEAGHFSVVSNYDDEAFEFVAGE
jgi:pimeloyl-ACP methyl ester carboxylesterase